MSATIKMTQEEKDKLLDAYDEAWRRGDHDAAWEFIRQIPVHRGLVQWVRECFTEEEIEEMGLIMPAPER